MKNPYWELFYLLKLIRKFQHPRHTALFRWLINSEYLSEEIIKSMEESLGWTPADEVRVELAAKELEEKSDNEIAEILENIFKKERNLDSSAERDESGEGTE